MSINRWGPATWYLFHTLAEKIKDEYFIEERQNILTVIKNVCNCLPCPDCKTHATNTISNVNFNHIKTKNDLKIFLMEFHNIVNKRTNKKPFTLNELNEKYSCGVLPTIIKHFVYIFQKPGGNINLSLMNSMNKTTAINNLINWYRKSYYKFNM